MKSNVQFARCVPLMSALVWVASFLSNAHAQTTTNRALPVITVQATDREASESGDPGTFTLFRAGPTNVGLTVFCQYRGTASSGVDYLPLPTWVMIKPGETSVDIVVQPIDDNLVEGSESVVLDLFYPSTLNPAGAPINYQIGFPSNAVVVILDNDTNHPPVVLIAMPTNGTIFQAPVNIPLAAGASDPDGYVATVEFFAGNMSLGVTTNNPMSAPPANPFMLVWSNAPPGQFVVSAKATDNGGAVMWSAPVTIAVNPPPQPVITILATDPKASEPGALAVVDSGVFTVSRSLGTNLDLPVFYSIGGTASNGVDYVLMSDRVTIPKGAWSADLKVVPLADKLVEGTETVVLHLLPPVCPAIWPPAPECYLVGRPAEAVVSIADSPPPTNQAPIVSIISPTNGSMFTAPVSLTLVATARDLDGTVATVEFFAGTTSLGFGTNMLAAGTARDAYWLIWSNVPPASHVLTAKATDNAGAVTVSAPVVIAVNPPPPPPQPVVAIRANDPYAAEPCSAVNTVDTGRFTVYRNLGTNLDLRVFYSISGMASNGLDYLAIASSVVIPQGAWSADIVIVPLADLLAEGTESVVLQLQPSNCPASLPPTPGCYLVGQPADAAVFISDCTPTNRPPVVQILRPQAATSFIAPANIGIQADTVDADGYVGLVEFFAGSAKIGEQAKVFPVAPPPGQHITFEMTWSNVPAGRYTLSAKATDNRGATASSPPVAIAVVTNVPPPFTNPAPVVTIFATDPVAIEGTNCWGWPTVTNRWPAGFVIGSVLTPNGGPPIWWFTNCGPKNATLTLRRTGDTNAPLGVYYAISGTATNGVDYQLLPSFATIPAGQRQVDVLIVPVADQHPDPLKTVVLRLAPAPGAVNPPPYAIGGPNSAAAVIVDSDRPRLPTGTLPDKLFHLGAMAPDSAWYRIEWSPDLTNWLPVGTNQAIQGAVHFVDPETEGVEQRFYRAVAIDPPPAQ